LINIINNSTKLILLLAIFVFCTNKLNAQKYSIDDGQLQKSGRVGIKYRIYQYKNDKLVRKDIRVIKKEERKARKYSKERIDRLQSKSTKKSMRELQHSSERINMNKPQEYWHQRVFKKLLDETQLTFLNANLFIDKTYNKITSIVSPANKNKLDKTKRYF
jgi:hypothetical protein